MKALREQGKCLSYDIIELTMIITDFPPFYVNKTHRNKDRVDSSYLNMYKNRHIIKENIVNKINNWKAYWKV